MTTKEFSDEFDVLLAKLSGDASFILDEYEKSVLLTRAQEQIVKSLYNGKLNGEPVEASEELRRGLDSLIKTDYPDEVKGLTGADRNSKFFKLKKDVWFITYESVELTEGAYCKDSNVVKVIPIKQDDWHRIKENPFRRPNKRKVIRLDNGCNISELISKYPISNYLVRYLCKPSPIVLADLEGLTINGYSNVTECKLNSAIHRPILDAAVLLAISKKTKS